jgi:BirA family transcriptional regulator, biotin operon repressor / biotin---[acetyl-CoA-carboxylase] ligase
MQSFNFDILQFDSLPSTNLEAAKRAAQGASEGLVIVANEQTAGRGRLGRRWASPKGAGLYFSVVLRPQVEPGRWALITFVAALAVHDALFECCGLQTDIKWPNDILADNRKLCGILAETVEGGAIVLGIGVNLSSTSFPEQLRETATSVESLTGDIPDRQTVLQSILVAFQRRYSTLLQEGGREQVINDWSKSSSFACGKRIRVKNGHETFEGITCGLEKDGALRVETSSGEIRIVRAGDVSLIYSKTQR